MDDTKWMTLRRVKQMFAKLAAKRLDTVEEIMANTSPGMLAGASALKEVNSSLTLYSSDEKIVGKWFGEILYEKSYQFGSVSNGYIIDNTINYNNINLISTVGVFYIGDGRQLPMPYAAEGAFENTVYPYLSNVGLQINFIIYVPASYRLTVRYTKK